MPKLIHRRQRGICGDLAEVVPVRATRLS